MTRPVPAIALIILIISSVLLLSCRASTDLPHFAEYLKAEQGMRRLVLEPQVQRDSLTALARRMSIERDQALAWLDGDPKRWNELIGLLNEKP